MALTPTQAISAARELRDQFHDHETLKLRRRIRQRQNPVPWEALGLDAGWKNIAPFESDVPEQEAHRYANAIASAEPEVAVFLQDSEKSSQQKIGERLEGFYDAAIQHLLAPEEYLRCVYQAGEGMGVGRFDLKREFWTGIPKRQKDEDADLFNVRVDDHRKALSLPFDFVTLDPSTFFYEENKKREVTVGVEWGRRKASVVKDLYSDKPAKNGAKGDDAYLGPTVPEDSWSLGTSDMVDFAVVRTPEVIYHLLMTGGRESNKVLWEGPNLFAPSTGYVLWRGMPSGYEQMDERYIPFIMLHLVNAQHWNLFQTFQFNFALMASRVWTESIPDTKGTPRAVGRDITAEAKGLATAKKTKGGVAADIEDGRIVRWREVSGDLRESLARLEREEEMYRFPEALAPESSSGESGRDTIRRQEASARLLRLGFEHRRQAVEECVRIIRRTLFTHKPFLADGRMVYVPHMVEGMGEEGTLRKQDLIAISESDNIPHEVQISVATMTQAGQLALNDEGVRLAGHLSQRTRDQDYFKIKNIPLEERRRQDDIIRQATFPITIERAVAAASQEIAARTPPGSPLVVPAEQGNGRVPGPVISAQPSPVETEDVGTMAGTEMGSVAPAMEGV